MDKMDRLDVLIKGVPVQLHNIFKGFCAMHDKTVNDGMVEAMAVYVERLNGGKNDAVKDVMDRYRQAAKKR
jgi:hypothetical protein